MSKYLDKGTAMDDDISAGEKILLADQAFKAFLDDFQPLDKHSVMFLEIIFEMLLGKKLT